MYLKRKISLPLGYKTARPKQETGNDCDVISGLKISGKTDFSDFFLFSYNTALLYHSLTNSLAHNKKMTEKSVFRATGQETGNDCDVISGLRISGKTDFSDFFLFSYNNALLYHSLTNSLAHNKKMTEKSVFRATSFPGPLPWLGGQGKVLGTRFVFRKL